MLVHALADRRRAPTTGRCSPEQALDVHSADSLSALCAEAVRGGPPRSPISAPAQGFLRVPLGDGHCPRRASRCSRASDAVSSSSSGCLTAKSSQTRASCACGPRSGRGHRSCSTWSSARACCAPGGGARVRRSARCEARRCTGGLARAPGAEQESAVCTAAVARPGAGGDSSHRAVRRAREHHLHLFERPRDARALPPTPGVSPASARSVA